MWRRRGVLVAAVATAALGFAVPGSPAAVTDLLARWSFNEGAGTTAADASGAGHAGTVSGGAQWIPGRLGQALRFDGATGRVRVPASAGLAPSAGVTVEAWVRRSGSPGQFRYVVSKGATACETASYGLYSGPAGGLVFYVAGPGPTDFTRSPDAGAGIWDGQWHHVAGTFDGAAVRLFVDGTEVASGTPHGDPISYAELSTGDLFVGHYDGCDGLDFAGDVDDVRIYGRALGAAEIKASMTYPFQGFFQPVDGQPAFNVAKAGSAIPIKFGLGGNEGLGILAAGSPGSGLEACNSAAPIDPIEETVSAGASSLSYDQTAGQYIYVWKTDKAWAGTCRRFVMRLDDGSSHVADFQFTR